MNQTIQPQAIQFSTKIETLNDAQKLLGTINWVRSYLGINNSQLAPQFDLLRGDPDLTFPRKLTPEAKAALELAEQAITNRQVHWICPEVCITVFIIIVDSHITGIIGQWNIHLPDPLHIIEWVFLPHRQKKTAPTVCGRSSLHKEQQAQLSQDFPGKGCVKAQRKRKNNSYLYLLLLLLGARGMCYGDCLPKGDFLIGQW